MGRISTHVLDTASGKPAGGMRLALRRVEGEAAREVATLVTNADGRTDGPVLEGDALKVGLYEIVFGVGDYFGEVCFFDTVPIRFRIVDAAAHYHVALLVTPWSYSTYRGS